MKIVLDTDQCEANGICAGLAPEVFDLDDDDVLHIREAQVGAADRAAIEEAVAQCPKAALRLE